MPVHYFVPLNQSSLSRADIQQLTYGLCFMYFNWCGPIKVPAPCMYAHKVAEYFTNVGVKKVKEKKFAQGVVALDERLYFL